jgi:ABC-2 type transport system ATP-binding protein
LAAVGYRYPQFLAAPDKLEVARALKPIDERQVFGKAVMLFDGVPRAQLATLGEIRNPGIADLFVAVMKGTYE